MSIVLRQASRTADELQAARQALNESIRKYKSIGELAADTQYVHTLARLVRQIARDEFSITDPTPLFFDRMVGPGLGNRLEIKEWVNTAKVVERSLGGKPKTYTPHAKKYGVVLRDFDINFAFELERVLTGQQDLTVWVDHMAEAISRHYVSTALSTIDIACAPGVKDAYGKNVRTSASTAIDATTLDNALKRLGDVSSDLVIAGRYSTLFPIMGFSGYSDQALEEIRRAGMAGMYKGARVVILRDSYNPFFSEPAVPADRIYIVGAEKGGVFVEEDMSALDYETIDQEEQHFRVGTKLRATFRVFKPWRYHVIEIN